MRKVGRLCSGLGLPDAPCRLAINDENRLNHAVMWVGGV